MLDQMVKEDNRNKLKSEQVSVLSWKQMLKKLTDLYLCNSSYTCNDLNLSLQRIRKENLEQFDTKMSRSEVTQQMVP
jgi:hypothetical protein